MKLLCPACNGSRSDEATKDIEKTYPTTENTSDLDNVVQQLYSQVESDTLFS